MPKDFYKDIKLSKTFNKSIVEKAYLYAKKAHGKQKRKSGDPYISHPVAVARILLELGMSHKVIAAAMLHDVIEDTDIKIEAIEKEFSKDIAKLVVGVTNLTKVDFSAYSNSKDKEKAKANAKNENLKSLFMAMSEDVRVVIIKLADRLHNMQTIKALSKENQERVALETLNIFSPLALRLGMGEFKGELEDLAFPIAYPEEYKKLKKEANRRYKAADRYTIKVKRIISDELKKANISAKTEGRAKHIYSLYKKIIRPEIDWDFDKIYDLVAIRIITETEEDCYRVMGIIHGKFRPIPNYVRDYIAAPKPNGYRSIHTTVFGPEEKVFELQIRTAEMHEEAEFGIASHLYYTEQKSAGKSDTALEQGTFADSKQTNFLKQIKNWQESVDSDDDFLEGLKLEFLDDRIYVFSPRGDIYDLSVGATPLDFAYEIHSDIGNTFTGAKVNGRIVPIDIELQTRDVIEIITQKNAAPKRGWLDFVKTSKAKQHIRSYFRKFDFENNESEGERIIRNLLSTLGEEIEGLPEAQIINNIKTETSFRDISSLYASVGEGITTPRQAVKIILGRPFLLEPVKKRPSTSSKVQKEDFKGMKIEIGTCCNPKKTDKVVCYITRGKGLTVHKKSCYNIKSLEKNRLIDHNPWVKENNMINIEIQADDRVGLIRDVADVFTRHKYNIEDISNDHSEGGGKSRLSILVDVGDNSDYVDLLSEIAKVNGVSKAKKI